MDTKPVCQARTKTGHACKNLPTRQNNTICPFHDCLDAGTIRIPGSVRLLDNSQLQAIYDAAGDGYAGMTMAHMCKKFGAAIFYNMCRLAIEGKTEEIQYRAGVFVSEKIYGKASMTINHNVKQQIEHIILPALGHAMAAVELDSDGNPILNLPEKVQEIIEAEVVPDAPQKKKP